MTVDSGVSTVMLSQAPAAEARLQEGAAEKSHGSHVPPRDPFPPSSAALASTPGRCPSCDRVG